MSMNGNTRPLGYIGKKPPPPRLSTQLGRKSPPPAETKRDKFRRLGLARMENAIDAIRLVGNLSRRDVYEYTAEEVGALKTGLYAAVNESVSQFDTRRKIEFAF